MRIWSWFLSIDPPFSCASYTDSPHAPVAEIEKTVVIRSALPAGVICKGAVMPPYFNLLLGISSYPHGLPGFFVQIAIGKFQTFRVSVVTLDHCGCAFRMCYNLSPSNKSDTGATVAPRWCSTIVANWSLNRCVRCVNLKFQSGGGVLSLPGQYPPKDPRNWGKNP